MAQGIDFECDTERYRHEYMQEVVLEPLRTGAMDATSPDGKGYPKSADRKFREYYERL